MPQTKPDPRKMMRRAIEAMRRSVAEPRADGKASPLVGAVLVLADGDIIEASRGELREGDHAEFTLLERKLRDRPLAGSTLYATLEPCAPGARRHPKLGCAERVVLARIKEVYVGIEDPDPLVDRKGIKYLEDNGVTVRMFDADLQEEIREANKAFIEQALERAAAAREEKPPVVILSRLEFPIKHAEMGDLSTSALERYRRSTGIAEEAGSPGFHRQLALQGSLREDGERFDPTGFGIILFATKPRDALQQAGLLGTIHRPDGREELRDFDGPQILAPEEAIRWMRDKLPDPIDRTEAKRRRVKDALYELAREGIVNALVHRDYDIAGAKCQLVATDDTIVVKSPGAPLGPVTLERLQAFDAPMLSRNPVLHYAFSRMDLAEERGLGLKSMKAKAEAAGLPLPRYSWDAPYLILTLSARAESRPDATDEILASLNSAEREGWRWLAAQQIATASEYALAINIQPRAALNHLRRFVTLGLVEKVGAGPTTRYRALPLPADS